MKTTKLLFALLAICALTFVLTACDSQKEQEINTPVLQEPAPQEVIPPVEEEPEVQMPNPIVEYDTVEDAVIEVGHLCTLPNIYARYNQRASVINHTLIQIVYSNDSGDVLTLREKAGTEEDISGNYNVYTYTDTFEANGNQVTVKGDSEESIKVVTWNDGAYAHSIDYENGASLEEVKAAINDIQ